MAEIQIEVKGLKELRARFAKMPSKYNAAMRKTMEASLFVLQENVPPYPPPPSGSTYRRTGTVGRSLGVGMAGRPVGQPDIKKVTGRVGSNFVGTFGTRLNYAPYVIGEREQARAHKGRWWTMLTIAKNATPKIIQVFEALTVELARFLDSGR